MASGRLRRPPSTPLICYPVLAGTGHTGYNTVYSVSTQCDKLAGTRAHRASGHGLGRKHLPQRFLREVSDVVLRGSTQLPPSLSQTLQPTAREDQRPGQDGIPVDDPLKGAPQKAERLSFELWVGCKEDQLECRRRLGRN
ncbi:uncharacterized protein An11g03370 [Aspergillus niger]|uniref:Contig An11c0150, genomic contig n=2 Tax=Aspergillus niger TaxID=5061 RepID=A2QW05_ASPNC|nr:uncharacterized protein An11g03370 [Aspergillus niger]CAK48328.1 unnamed protein product [Aspergillus niger]